jgi:hypothetical protein
MLAPELRVWVHCEKAACGNPKRNAEQIARTIFVRSVMAMYISLQRQSLEQFRELRRAPAEAVLDTTARRLPRQAKQRSMVSDVL